MIKIFLPEVLNEKGERATNQDAIYPKEPTIESNIFLVCDGVGGHVKGEVASQLICDHFPIYLSRCKSDLTKKEVLNAGLLYVEEKLKNFLKDNPDAKNMASTLLILCLSQNNNNVAVGWVGDSRVYHIRNGVVLYKTKDHSEVQNLLDMGELSEKEAITYPRKNVITRAVSGNNPARMDYHKIEDILENDFFLLCTDGILENLDESKMTKWFKAWANPLEVKAQILNNAKNKTKDNYSMQLIKIRKIINEHKPKKKWFWQNL